MPVQVNLNLFLTGLGQTVLILLGLLVVAPIKTNTNTYQALLSTNVIDLSASIVYFVAISNLERMI